MKLFILKFKEKGVKQFAKVYCKKTKKCRNSKSKLRRLEK